MQQYKRKEWFTQAVLLSLLIHLMLFGSSFFIKLHSTQPVFHITMDNVGRGEYYKSTQVTPSDPLFPAPHLSDIPIDLYQKEPTITITPTGEESESEVMNLEESQLIIEENIYSDSELDLIEPTPPVTKSLPVKPQEPTPPVTKSPPVKPQEPAPPVTKSPPIKPQEPTPPVTKSPPVKPQEPTPPVTKSPPVKPQESAPPVTKSPPVKPQEPTPPEEGVKTESEKDIPSEASGDGSAESTELGEEWKFLQERAGDGSEQTLVDDAQYSLQNGTRRIIKEPDFSFLRKQTYYTKVAYVRVRLSILADGIVTQAVMIGAGSGNNELDQRIIDGLLSMVFNDVSMQRKGTQIGILTIRFQ
ncbi:hypothetical protein PVA45_06805 [Entomospira entomophila]|uniref:Uncharacterized protein n=1 Tax=Entomospira entomophila TaxID=2719988 RepID=A0A968G9S9_9SPIO|nr:hypothetical protein [Entomospira entomophilus]NIZ41210.1 hypothetical protein [Entomospira entomophilus]WDI35416.1 hypothetical protein PVA45_06805 [Entomospira entomophilus]